MYPVHMKFAVAGVSGAGKSSLLKLLQQIEPSVTLHVKDTTRTRRPTETEDNFKDLSFLAQQEFDRNNNEGAYDVVYQHSGNLYGVRRDQILRAVQQKEVHFVIIRDIPSIGKFKFMYRDARAIYIHADPRDIPAHLQEREGIDREERIKRMERSYQEFIENSTLFDHIVLNFWGQENAVRQLRNIINYYIREAATNLRG